MAQILQPELHDRAMESIDRMNRRYRLVWNRLRQCLVVAAEIARGRRQAGRDRRSTPTCRHAWLAGVLALASLAATAGQLPSAAAPGGGRVTAGQGTIRQSASATTIEQRSQNLSLGWQSFNVGADHTVTFVQPNAQAIAVNRIADPHGSTILGRIQANGQVFLLNPNGVLFGSSAQVSVGGLVASTLDLDDGQLASGTRRFSGQGRGSVVNQGTLRAAPDGYVALIGPQVTNRGTLAAPGGTVAMGAGDAVTLSFDADRLLSLQVDRSTLDALADNRQLIQADGGQVLMSAGAKDTLLASVVNNTGLIQAQTVDRRNGRIVLLGGMEAGSTNVAGTLDASAPHGGDGGFIETSAARVKVADGAKLTTQAATGRPGSWLIDPQDYTIAASGGDMSGAALSAALAGTDVSIQSASGTSAGSGNIDVNDAVAWNANTKLTLTASNDVNINANLTATGAGAGLVLAPNTTNGADTASGSGQYHLNNGAVITLSGAHPSLSITGQGYTVINSLGAQNSTTGTDLQGMNGNLAGHYALGSDIDASATASWKRGNGFPVIGAGTDTVNCSDCFSGTFDGLGHTVTGLYGTGFFGTTTATGDIRNVGLPERTISSAGNFAGLAKINHGTIDQAWVAGNMVGRGSYLGGLVAYNYGSISRSHVDGLVQGWSWIGGLVGVNTPGSSITQSYSTADVVASDTTAPASNVGGLVGINNGATITRSYATGAVSGGGQVGGFAGVNQGTGGQIAQSWSSGKVTGTIAGTTGGFAGFGGSAVTDSYWDSYSSGVATSSGGSNVAGIIAVTSDPAKSSAANYAFKQSAYAKLDFAPGSGGWFMPDGGTRPFLQAEYSVNIRNAHQLQLVAANLGAAYTLANDIDAGRTAGADMWNAAGFSPLGTSTTPFSGAFDGMEHSIAGLSINRPTTSNIGLFGYVGSGGRIDRIGLDGGTVRGGAYTGSLVGLNYGTISRAHASTTVTSTGSFVGGLVGTNALALVGADPVPGTIKQSYATGTVTGGSYAGGLVGGNGGGVISQAYATGAVKGTNLVGGLAGAVQASNAESGQIYSKVSQAWSSGSVQATGTGVAGGFAGYSNSAMVTSSYWDTYSSGLATGSGATNQTGIVAVTSDPGLSTATNYALKQSAYPNLDFASGWFMVDGSTRPFLQTEYSSSIGNAHQLQLAAMNLGAAYTLARNIDLAETSRAVASVAPTDAAGMWGNAGFSPLGSPGTPFTGSLDGQNHTLSNLAIQRPGSAAVGLFGTLAAGSSVGHLGLAHAAVSGGAGTGILAGENRGTITGAYASGSVQGAAQTGGLVGDNAGTLAQSYAAGSVAGTDAVGGLVGNNSGAIGQSYATASTTGNDGVGGLVGNNSGTINQTYATGAVTGASHAGGLAGTGTGVTSSYWDTQASGQATSAGGAGATGLASAQMTDPSSFGWGIGNAGTDSTTWRMYPGYSAPLLRTFMTSLTVMSSNITLAYDATVFAGSTKYTVGSPVPTGWLPSATFDAGLLGGVLNTLAPQSDAGSYLLNGGLYSSQLGYDLRITSATLRITPAPLGVTGAVAVSKTYDGTTTASIGGAALTGTIYGSDAVTLANATVGQFADKNAGTGKAVTMAATLAGAGAGNYELTQPTGLAADISPADVTVSGIAAADKTYDGTTAATLGLGSAVLTGKIAGDALAVGAASGAFDTKDVGTGKTVAISGIALAGADAANYTLLDDTATAIAAITPATLTYTAAAHSTTYGTPATGLTGTLTGFVGTDTQATAVTGTMAWATTAGATSNVGSYAIDGSGLGAANYVFVQAPGNATALTIGPAPLGIGTLDISKVYDGTTTASGTSVAVTGTLFGTDSLSGGTFAFDTRDVGTGKTVTVSGVTVHDGNGGANYAVTYVPNTHSRITPRPVVLAPIASVSGITAEDKVYDGGTAATLDFAGAVFNGMASGDHLAVAGASGAFSDKNAGTAKTVFISGITLGGMDASNYTLLDTTATTTATILPLGIGVQLSGRDKVYDGTTAAMLDLAASGVLPGDQVQFGATGHFDDRNAGAAKPVTVDAVTATGADAGNYRITHNAGTTADITPASLTYLAEPRDAASGRVPTDLAGTVTGLVGGDTLATATSGTLGWSTPATAASPAGHYPIVGGGLAAPNYVFQQAPGNASALYLGAIAASAAATPQGTATIVAQLQQTNGAAPANRQDDDPRSPAFAYGRSAAQGLTVPYVRIVDGGVRMP